MGDLTTPPDLAAIRELVGRLRVACRFGTTGPADLGGAAAAIDSLLAERKALEAELAESREQARTLRFDRSGYGCSSCASEPESAGPGCDCHHAPCIHDRNGTIKELRADLARVTAERDALRRVGGLLSNVAYNLAQKDSLSERWRSDLDRLRRDWDAALGKGGAR